jgi:hypothetical protein
MVSKDLVLVELVRVLTNGTERVTRKTSDLPLIYTSPLQVHGHGLVGGGIRPTSIGVRCAQEATSLVGGTVTVATVMVACRTLA